MNLKARVLHAALFFGVTTAVPLHATANSPIDTAMTFTIPEGTACKFGVAITLIGAVNGMPRSDNRFIVASHGLIVRLTNRANPNKQVTRSITGTLHVLANRDGNEEIIAIGRALVLDPSVGLVFSNGRFSYVNDRTGINVRPLSGQGQLTDACAQIT
jgi:hypothetical protein